MKKIFQVVFVVALVVGAIGVARSNAGRASGLADLKAPSWGSELIGTVLNTPASARVTITEDGVYNIGGVCLLEVDVKKPDAGIKVEADAEIPIKESSKVPFSGEGELFYPGCHFVIYKQDKVISPADAEDVNLKVCFGANPDIAMKIYYYLDNPESGGRVWQPLPTTLDDENRLACAPVEYTGVYMPAGKVDDKPKVDLTQKTITIAGEKKGTVRTPPQVIKITESGTYSAGGICTLRAVYFVSNLADEVKVAYPEQDTLTVPFPGSDELLYFPGCHVLHYRDNKIKPEMTRDEGEWEICFAARPGKQMTIYYYRDDLKDITPPWTPLESRTSGGLVCAKLVDFSAVYTPAGK